MVGRVFLGGECIDMTTDTFQGRCDLKCIPGLSTLEDGVFQKM